MTVDDTSIAAGLVEFLGLTSAVGPPPERALVFRLGVLYPYSDDLRRVYDRYIAVAGRFPDAEPLLVGGVPGPSLSLREGDDASAALDRYAAAIGVLHARTGFASLAIDTGVEHAHASVHQAIARAKDRVTTRNGGT